MDHRGPCKAVTAAVRQLQTYAATRVRKQNQYSHRTTGNVVGAVFRHDTSRALDPHLHSHYMAKRYASSGQGWNERRFFGVKIKYLCSIFFAE